MQKRVYLLFMVIGAISLSHTAWSADGRAVKATPKGQLQYDLYEYGMHKLREELSDENIARICADRRAVEKPIHRAVRMRDIAKVKALIPKHVNDEANYPMVLFWRIALPHEITEQQKREINQDGGLHTPLDIALKLLRSAWYGLQPMMKGEVEKEPEYEIVAELRKHNARSFFYDDIDKAVNEAIRTAEVSPEACGLFPGCSIQ